MAMSCNETGCPSKSVKEVEHKLRYGKNSLYNEILKYTVCPAVVVHVCNPSYSGGRDQEDHGSKPARAK
jgi:hypothetical protein